ncbi:hypothetical protein FS799_03120 [Agrobacterium vitis]|nr:hypothetical protein [Agrobacterium vitis]
MRDGAKQVDIDRYRAKIKRAMARAIRECDYDRPTTAARMAHYLSLPNVSKATLTVSMSSMVSAV